MFRSSLSPVTLTWASEISSSGSWMSLYVPLTSDIISFSGLGAQGGARRRRFNGAGQPAASCSSRGGTPARGSGVG